MHSKTALQQRSDTRFLRGLCAPLAHLIFGGCRVRFWSATTSVVIRFGVAALCADLVELALGLGALAEYMEEGRGRFEEFDIHARVERLVISYPGHDPRPHQNPAKILLGCPILKTPASSVLVLQYVQMCV